MKRKITNHPQTKLMQMAKTSLIILFFIPFVAGFSGCLRDSKMEEDKKLLQILESCKNPENSNCIKTLLSFANENPNNETAWQTLGALYVENGDFINADNIIEYTLRLNPCNAVSLLNKARILDNTNEEVNAEKYYLKSLNCDSTIYQTYSHFALNQLYNGNYEKAVLYGEKAVKLGSNIKDISLLCLSYHKVGNATKRDSLLLYLKSNNYTNYDKLVETITDSQ